MRLVALVELGKSLASEYGITFSGIQIWQDALDDSKVELTLRFWTPHSLYVRVTEMLAEFGKDENIPPLTATFKGQIEEHLKKYPRGGEHGEV